MYKSNKKARRGLECFQNKRDSYILFIRQNALFQNISLTLAGLNFVKDEFRYHILVKDEKLNRL
jgi:hypothetical protein